MGQHSEMNIRWIFMDDSLFYQDDADEVRALVWSKTINEPGIYTAEVQLRDDLGWAVVADKEDASLVEIICWAEEELKFRMAHAK